MSPLGSSQLFFSVREFIARETRLLQEGRFEEWLELFSRDIRYWMPIASVSDTRAGSESATGALALYDDTFETLKLRIERLRSRNAWTEIPPSRVRYFIEPYLIEQAGGKLKVASNVMVRQCRLQREDHLFTGYREDVLVEGPTGYSISERRIVMDEVVIQAKNLTVFL